MKKYIKPTIEIEISDLEMTLLAGLSKHEEVGSDDEFSNTSSYDNNDDMPDFTKQNLWNED